MVTVAPSSGEIPSDEALLVNEHKVPPRNPPVWSLLRQRNKDPEHGAWMRRHGKRGKGGAERVSREEV